VWVFPREAMPAYLKAFATYSRYELYEKAASRLPVLPLIRRMLYHAARRLKSSSGSSPRS